VQKEIEFPEDAPVCVTDQPDAGTAALNTGGGAGRSNTGGGRAGRPNAGGGAAVSARGGRGGEEACEQARAGMLVTASPHHGIGPAASPCGIVGCGPGGGGGWVRPLLGEDNLAVDDEINRGGLGAGTKNELAAGKP
jgi:hypothetical protein